MNNEKIDVAINIFAKPFQTSLSILSLIARSGSHIGSFWLQFEPAGSKFDSFPPYYIKRYISELGFTCNVWQPEIWLAREPPDPDRLCDKNYRMAIRYQHAFENSQSRLLFLTHNDVYILKDILGALKANMDDAFAIGQLGQCWNCPAHNTEIMREVMDSPPCSPDNYQNIRPNHQQLIKLYHTAREKGIFARPYEAENFEGEFARQPWPLPECRVNEWTCLLDLEKTRPLCIPYGKASPPGAFRHCASHNLDIGTPWFRDMHALGLHALNFDISPYVKHWVGTGNKSAGKYAKAEDNALNILKKYFPDYVKWLARQTGDKRLLKFYSNSYSIL